MFFLASGSFREPPGAPGGNYVQKMMIFLASGRGATIDIFLFFHVFFNEKCKNERFCYDFPTWRHTGRLSFPTNVDQFKIGAPSRPAVRAELLRASAGEDEHISEARRRRVQLVADRRAEVAEVCLPLPHRRSRGQPKYNGNTKIIQK